MLNRIWRFIQKLFVPKPEPDFQVGPTGIYLKPVGSHETNPFDKPQ